MHIVLLGAPGAGKGTQADQLAEHFHIPKISTGDILRRARQDQTPYGKKAEAYMKKGALVPDELVIDIIKERLERADCQRGYILDGFPRSVKQAHALDAILESFDTKLSAVVEIELEENELIQRISGRRQCSQCQRGYHLLFQKPVQDDLCDDCQIPLVQRGDDKEEVVKERLKVYTQQTKSVADYYRSFGLLQQVDGKGEINQIFENILAILPSPGPECQAQCG
jgi:adenylate kinase